MAGFDAGKIESTMTVDRRPFTQGLAAARRQGRRFAGETFTASMDVDTHAATASIRKLRADMARAGSLSRHMQVTADTSQASAAMRAVQAQQRRMQQQQTSTVGVDTSAATARVSALQRQLAGLNNSRRSGPTVNADTATASTQLAGIEAQLARLHASRAEPKVRVQGVGAAIGQMNLLMTAAVGLGPAIVPMATAAAGGVMALVGALGAAAGGFAIVGAAAVGPIMELFNLRTQIAELDAAIASSTPGSERYNELMAERAAVLASVTPQQQAVLDGVSELGKAFMEFGKPAEDAIMGALVHGLNAGKAVLDTMKPAVEPLADTFLTLMRNMEAAMSGPGMVTFRDWIMTNGPPAMLWFASTIGNVIVGVGNLVAAFDPLTQRMMTAEGSMQGFREWASGLEASPVFQEFLAYIIETGPLVRDTLAQLVSAVAQIGWALAPIAPYVLQVVHATAQWLANLAQTHPWVIQLAWGVFMLTRFIGPAVAVMGLMRAALQSQAALWLLTRARMLAYGAVMLVVRGATAAWTAVQWALNVAMSANPVGLVIAVILLLVAAVVWAWNNVDWFREAVVIAWNAIAAGALWLWNNALKPVIDWIVNAFTTYLLPAIMFVVNMWVGYWTMIWNIVQTVWGFIWPVIQFIALVAFALIVTYLGVLWAAWKQIFTWIGNIATWLWQNAIKPAVDGIVWLWNNWLLPQINKAKARWDVIMRAVGALMTWLWQNIVQPVANWISTKWNWLVAKFQTYRTMIQVVFNVIGSYITTLRERFRTGFDKIKEFASNLVRAFRGMRDSAKDIFKQVANQVRRPINWVINTVYNDGIRKVSRNVLTAVGMSELADRIPAAKTIPTFAAGGSPMDPSGFVRGAGSGTSDDILARIANREFVVNARATAMFRPLLEWMNNRGRRAAGNRAAAMPGNMPAGLPGFNRGGAVSSALSIAGGAFLGGAEGALREALEVLGWNGWIRGLKNGPPIWEGAAGGALGMVTNGLLSFLSKEDEKGGGGMGVVQQARKAKMGGSDYSNEYTRAFGMLGAPWCAMFVSEMIKRAGAQKPYKNVRSAAVASFANSSMKSVSPSAGRPGDLAVYRGSGGPGGWSHINIVSDHKKQESIGGNESNRIRRQYGYYNRAVKLMRPSAAAGGMITYDLLRQVMGQDYDTNTRGTTPVETQVLRNLVGLPGYADGGPVEYRAKGGRLGRGDVAWVGEQGPELIRVGSQARVHSAPDSERIAGRGEQGPTYNFNVSGIATIEELRQFAREQRTAEQRRSLVGTVPGPPKPHITRGEQ